MSVSENLGPGGRNALPNTNLSMSLIRSSFGGASTNLSTAYYRGGGNVRNHSRSGSVIPTSGQFSIGVMRGKRSAWISPLIAEVTTRVPLSGKGQVTIRGYFKALYNLVQGGDVGALTLPNYGLSPSNLSQAEIIRITETVNASNNTDSITIGLAGNLVNTNPFVNFLPTIPGTPDLAVLRRTDSTNPAGVLDLGGTSIEYTTWTWNVNIGSNRFFNDGVSTNMFMQG
jgi:hypothetical protein